MTNKKERMEYVVARLYSLLYSLFFLTLLSLTIVAHIHINIKYVEDKLEPVVHE
jgi:hypothetical protein